MSDPSLDERRALWRAEVPVLERFVPLNHCSQAPPNRRTRAALDRYLSSWEGTGMDWDAWMGEVEHARAAFARLIGADPAHIAVASSVSQAVSSIAGAIEYVPHRDEVVVDAAEFPTVSHVWAAQARRGARVRTVRVEGRGYDPAQLSVTEQTAVLSLTHGSFADGTLRELDGAVAAAREVGAVVLVDAYQTLGAVPFDVDTIGADVVVSGCLKYLLGLPGIAFVYVRPGTLDSHEPLATGWFGRVEPFAFSSELDWADGARRFDLGTPPIVEAHVARAGIEWLTEVGLDVVRASTIEASAALLEGGQDLGLTVAGPREVHARTPVVAFEVEDAAHLESALREQSIIASARGGVLRFAPHFYTSASDVEDALAATAAILGR